jgi:predicted transcriptional regulator
MSWTDIDDTMKQKRCQRPKGGLTVIEIAAKYQWTENHARRVVKEAIANGQAEQVDGWKKIHTGRLCREVYYVMTEGKVKAKK